MNLCVVVYKHIVLIILLYAMTDCVGQSGEDFFAEQRERMVKTQIRARGITDPGVLKAMESVPRHKFVPAAYQKQAYIDSPLPIGAGQTISQPYIVALMTEVLDLEKTDRVLEIGTGSGYQAAVLASICDSVFSIEVIEMLGLNSEKVLKETGYDNVYVKIGDGYQGWPEKSPFDAIMVTCAPTHVPQPLRDQLKEGGKMIIPVGESYAQELVLMVKRKGKLDREDLIPVRFVPMINSKGTTY